MFLKNREKQETIQFLFVDYRGTKIEVNWKNHHVNTLLCSAARRAWQKLLHSHDISHLHLVEIWVNTQFMLKMSTGPAVRGWWNTSCRLYGLSKQLSAILPKGTAYARHTTSRTDLVAALVCSVQTQKRGMAMTFPKHNGSERFLFMLTFTVGELIWDRWVQAKLAGARLAATTPHSGDVLAERMTDEAQDER